MKIVQARLCAFLMGVLSILTPHRLLAQSQGTPQLNLAPGSYQISPVSNNEACLDVSGASVANGTKIQVYSCNNTFAQSWSIVPVSTSFGVGYQFVSATSGSCLDIAADSTADGALMHEWQCLGAGQLSQLWQPFPFGSSYELVSLYDGKCLDLPSGKSLNGTPLQQWDCGAGGNTNQLWNLVGSSPEGTPLQDVSPGPYRISPVVNGNVCTDVSGASTVSGGTIQAYQCNGTAAQAWTFVPLTTAVGTGYQIVNKNSGECLDISGDSLANGAAVHQWQCLGVSQLSQIWQVFPFGSSFEIVSLSSGSCLDLSNGSTSNGNQLQQWSCGQGANKNQLWTLDTVLSAAAPAIFVTTTLVQATPSAAVTGQTILLTGQVTSSSGTPSGNLNFLENGALLGTAPLNGNGMATFSVPALANGSYSITAQFPGTSAFTASSASAQVTVAASSSGQQAATADSFVDSIGVQTHLGYLGTPYYTQWPQVFDRLKASGIRHVRDGINTSSTILAEHQQLAAAGIGALIGAPLDASSAKGLFHEFAARAGDLDSIESPNECDNGQSCGISSLAGIANVTGLLPTLDVLGQQLGVPVVGPSFVSPLSYGISGNLSGLMDDNNLHIYFGGRNPGSVGWGGGDAQGNRYGSFLFWLDQTNLNGQGLPVMITETGYISYPTTNIPWTIPESVEANYKPRMLLLAFNHGIKRTYLYELVDEVAEPGFGLLRNDLSEKPAFVAIKQLAGLLSDPGATFQPGKLSYSLTGGDTTITTTLLQKRDGSFWLVLWSEQSSYDPSTNTPTPVATQNVTLSLSGAAVARTIYHFDTTGAATSSPLTSVTQTVTLPVNDSLTVVQITPP